MTLHGVPANPCPEAFRVRIGLGKLRGDPTVQREKHRAYSATALLMPLAATILIGFLLAGCTATRTMPPVSAWPSLPTVPTAPWTPERNDDAGTVTMVCRERSTDPSCMPYGPRAAADALSVCRVMGYEDALMRSHAQARTSLFEQSVRYSVTFDCVGSDDE